MIRYFVLIFLIHSEISFADSKLHSIDQPLNIQETRPTTKLKMIPSQDTQDSQIHRSNPFRRIKDSNHSQKAQDFQPHLSRSIFPVFITLYGLRIHATVFYVGDNRFVTNFHVLSLGENHSLLSKENSVYMYYEGQHLPFEKIIAIDRENDLAVLKLNSVDFKNIQPELASLELDSNQDFSSVSLYGFDFANLKKNEIHIHTNTYEEAHFFLNLLVKIRNFRMASDHSIVWGHNDPILQAGMSGSPLINNRKVVGVLCCGNQKALMGIHVSHLIHLLESLENKQIQSL